MEDKVDVIASGGMSWTERLFIVNVTSQEFRQITAGSRIRNSFANRTISLVRLAFFSHYLQRKVRYDE